MEAEQIRFDILVSFQISQLALPYSMAPLDVSSDGEEEEPSSLLSCWVATNNASTEYILNGSSSENRIK